MNIFKGYNPWFLEFFGQNEKTRFYDVWASQIKIGFGGIELSHLVREKNRFGVLGELSYFLKVCISVILNDNWTREHEFS